MQQKILLKNSNVEHYRGYDIFQSKNGYFFAISNNPDYLDVDGCETSAECKEEIDATIDGLFEEVE